MATETIEIKTAKWSPDDQPEAVIAFLTRPAFDTQAEESARLILNAVRKEGDEALIRFAREHDSCQLAADAIAVSQNELNEAREKVDNKFIVAAREVHKRVLAFARAGMKKNWSMSSPKGGTLGEQFTPLGRVGVYIPGGQAPLVSTVLMTVTLAKAAGVPEIAACSPVGASGQMNPHLLVALELAGANEIYKIGGGQAIGAMAYGTKTVKKVQKIVGPGGQYVTAAKRLVYGEVALDLVAGPSEIAILADDSAAPEAVAADLLSQAEHDPQALAMCITTSEELAAQIVVELKKQLAKLSRAEIAKKSLSERGVILVAEDLEEAILLANRIAAEHLELMVSEPFLWLTRVRHAGAIFLGRHTPESAGDYLAGPNHVLPTMGTARFSSALGVETFLKKSSLIAYSEEALRADSGHIQLLARLEGLTAHANSVAIRTGKK